MTENLELVTQIHSKINNYIFAIQKSGSCSALVKSDTLRFVFRRSHIGDVNVRKVDVDVKIFQRTWDPMEDVQKWYSPVLTSTLTTSKILTRVTNVKRAHCVKSTRKFPKTSSVMAAKEFIASGGTNSLDHNEFAFAIVDLSTTSVKQVLIQVLTWRGEEVTSCWRQTRRRWVVVYVANARTARMAVVILQLSSVWMKVCSADNISWKRWLWYIVVLGSCILGSCLEHTLLHFQGSIVKINLYLEVVLSGHNQSALWKRVWNVYDR